MHEADYTELCRALFVGKLRVDGDCPINGNLLEEICFPGCDVSFGLIVLLICCIVAEAMFLSAKTLC